jgi:hypothetical protein
MRTYNVEKEVCRAKETAPCNGSMTNDHTKTSAINVTITPTHCVWNSLSYFNNYKRDDLTFY